jgi:hypothetical protein
MPSDACKNPGVADALASVADGAPLPPAASAHIATCLRCQAEVTQYRRLARTLRELESFRPAVPPALEHQIVLAIDKVDDRVFPRVPARAAAALGGIAAAAGVIVLATRGVTRQRRVSRVAV